MHLILKRIRSRAERVKPKWTQSLGSFCLFLGKLGRLG
nr:MAG TPA: hypothetical protein [Caudoviricetes sp.]DAH64977.1 MAG TPA: hypothetical protein [Bacteriophage sp.]